MDTLNPRQRGTLVEALGSAVFHGGTAIGDVPALLKRVLESGAWREFETPTHEVITYDRFEAFVTTPPTRGLGAMPDLIERIIQPDEEALLLFRNAMKVGQGTRTDIPSNFSNNVTEVVRGNDKAYALDRLSRERPDLYEQVKAHELSAHAAMVQAGFRRRTLTVPIDDIDRLAQTLRRHLDDEQLRQLFQIWKQSL